MSAKSNKDARKSVSVTTQAGQVKETDSVENNEPTGSQSQQKVHSVLSSETVLGQNSGSESGEDFQIDQWLFPVLELERYQVPTQQRIEDANRADGCIRYGLIGSGGCGNRIVRSFYQLGYTKVLALDTTSEELDLLEMPAGRKYLIRADFESEPIGRNMEIGSKAVGVNQQKLLHLARETFGTAVDHIMVCIGAGGGTGGGSVFGLVEVAKRYARYIGLENPNKSVGVVMVLPASNIGSGLPTAENAYKVASKLSQMASAGKISPLIIIDNDVINKIQWSGKKQSLWSGINEGFAELFDKFNRLSSQSSPYTSFDPIEYRSIIQAGGCMMMGASQVNNPDDPFAISEAVKNSLGQSFFAADFDLSTTRQAGCIVVGAKKLIASIKGLQNNIDYAFDVLNEITGNATIYRGIYEDDGDVLRVYTIVGGLRSPSSGLQQLHKRQYTRPNLSDLEGLPLSERREDIIPLAEYFLLHQAQKYSEPYKQLSPRAKKLLVNYTWPGNVRQLAAAIERAFTLTADELIQADALPFEIVFSDCRLKDEKETSSLDVTRAEIIKRALELTGGNNKAAAAIVGISTGLLEWYVENYNAILQTSPESNSK